MSPSLHMESGSACQDTWGWHQRRGGGARTVGAAATVEGVTQTQLSLCVAAPALDGRVVLWRAVSTFSDNEVWAARESGAGASLAGAVAGVPQRAAVCVGANPPILNVPASQSPNTKSYQQRARMRPASTDGHGRPPSPQVDRGEARPHLCTRRTGAGVRTRGAKAGTRCTVVGHAREGPLAPLPRLTVSPCPSCPPSFFPQHFTVASSCDGDHFVRDP